MGKNYGKRKTDTKIGKYAGYADTVVKVIITLLITFGVNVCMNINSKLAVIELSYKHALAQINNNKEKIEMHQVCLQKQEIKLAKLEEKI